jgi:hypothetical protein
LKGVCDVCGSRYYSADLLHAVDDIATGTKAVRENRRDPGSTPIASVRLESKLVRLIPCHQRCADYSGHWNPGQGCNLQFARAASADDCAMRLIAVRYTSASGSAVGQAINRQSLPAGSSPGLWRTSVSSTAEYLRRDSLFLEIADLFCSEPSRCLILRHPRLLACLFEKNADFEI